MLEFWSAYLYQPWNVLAAGLTAAALLFAFVGLSAFLAIWAERKVSGRIQDRLGPSRVGPFGLLQSLADAIKLLAKEDHAPAGADRPLFRLAPYLAFCASFTGFLALPFGAGLVGWDLQVAAFFMLAVLSSEVFGVVLAGYASGSKWSLFGGMREAAQVVSYEVPRSLCVVIPVCLAGTLNLNTMARQQVGGFWEWNIFHDPFAWLAFFVFFITATASCKRAPFDLAEAESELVAGFHTEYSGFRWSI
ncbi:MAG: NADH-quinone oxidoreductase subunit H, partial [Gemmataceae bacterium]|nr:NADH-quinone oxidoreductase subunit H [Gemmataceae bacterium]